MGECGVVGRHSVRHLPSRVKLNVVGELERLRSFVRESKVWKQFVEVQTVLPLRVDDMLPDKRLPAAVDCK